MDMGNTSLKILRYPRGIGNTSMWPFKNQVLPIFIHLVGPSVPTPFKAQVNHIALVEALTEESMFLLLILLPPSLSLASRNLL